MKKIVVIACSMLILCCRINAKDVPQSITTLDELIASMEQAEEEISSVQFDFKQYLSIPYSGEQQEITGKAYFRKPMNIRVEHSKPEKNIFITDGTHAWYYSKSLKQVMAGTWEEIAQGSSNFFRGILNINQFMDDLMERYNISLNGKKGSLYELLVTPKGGKAMYEMTIWIDEKDFFPYQTELRMDTMTIKTEIFRIRKNKPLSDGLFTFTVPSGVMELPFPY